MNPSALRVSSAIVDAYHRLPDVDLVTKPTVGDADWHADHCCCTVYLSPRLIGDELADGITAGVNTLLAETIRSGWLQTQIPRPRGQHEPVGRVS